MILKSSFRRIKKNILLLLYPDIFQSDTLDRMYTIHPNNQFFLRILLHNVIYPT